MIKVPEYIESLVPYKSGNSLDGKVSKEEFDKLINLASNENPLGPSPKAMQALTSYRSELNTYPNPAAPDLVTALAKKMNIAENRIVTGHGSDSLIQYLFNAFAEKGDEILTASATFIGSYVNANKLGLKLKLVPNNDEFGFDLDAIANAITDKTKIVYLANPNNPTGTMFTKDEFDTFIKKVPENVLVILDEAYWIYAEEFDDYPNGLDYDLPNLIVLRTLSKSYGLAGLRVGFAIGPEKLINYIYRVKLPFEPHSLAQVAAIACLEDDEFIEKTVQTNKESMALLTGAMDELGIKYTKPTANFTMMVFDSEEKAKSITDGFLKNGIIVRHLPMFGLANGVRISSGTIEQTEKAIKILNKLMDEK